MTPEDVGDSVCFIVSRLYRCKTETLYNYDKLQMRDQDRQLHDELVQDGLLLGDWITIPDPWEDDWPFAKRHPNRRCPPDPELIAIEKRGKTVREKAVAKKDLAATTPAVFHMVT